ncbi:hypothetical protein SDC9_83495 [bioreactor metagenome]|uniref:Phage protein n=1 Tax=bioreactor metagenome TaxID=1076179 RepID=A0A644ZA95_9ZZZZ
MNIDVKNMSIAEFIDYRIKFVQEEISDLILDMEKVAHSPSEMAFMAGRIAELNYEILTLKDCLNDCQ